MIKTPHPHLNIIIQWASDPTQVIEYWDEFENKWEESGNPPMWEPMLQYRIKPEPKPPIKLWAQIYRNAVDVHVCSTLLNWPTDCDNVEFTFNGDTQELINVKLINKEKS